MCSVIPHLGLSACAFLSFLSLKKLLDIKQANIDQVPNQGVQPALLSYNKGEGVIVDKSCKSVRSK